MSLSCWSRSDLLLLHANRAGRGAAPHWRPARGAARSRRRPRPASQRALSVALAAPPRAGIGRRGLGVPARRSDGEALVLHVLPLADEGLLPAASAAIFVAPATAPPPPPVAAIAALFDLTPTEARVLELIAAGRTNAEIAVALGVALSTVRTHLLHLFEKTRTHRQADLAALLASFSLPLV